MLLSFLFITLSALKSIHGQVSECNGQFKYQFLSNEDDFAGHQANCVVRGGDLATINDEDTRDFIQDFLRSISGIVINDVAFGLFSDIGTSSQNLTLYVFEDGSVNEFGLIKGADPWRNNEPSIDDINQRVCVVTRPSLNNGPWFDRQCTEDSNQGICQLPCDQGVPTRNPSKNPTKNPTKIPTKNPTMSPTPPTTNPTRNPTKNPTTNPTQNPTRNPTRNPTKTPTKNPTKAPTTPGPTQNPTRNPTKNPTKQPTRKPTISPTQNPTKSPFPTSSPTAGAAEAGVEAGMIVGVLFSVCVLFLLVGVLFAFRDRIRPLAGRRREDSDDFDGKDQDLEAKIAAYTGAPVKSKTNVSPKGEISTVVAKKSVAVPPVVAVSSAQSAAKPLALVMPVKRSAPKKKVEVDEDIAMLDSIVAKSTPAVKTVDEDIALLDSLVAAGQTAPAVDEDVAMLDSLVAANTPNQNYLKSTDLKPVGHRSIFAPSPEFIKKNVKKQEDEDDLDI